MKRRKKLGIMLVMIMMAAIIQTGCGSSGGKAGDMAAAESAPMEAPAVEEYYADGIVTNGSSMEMKGEADSGAGSTQTQTTEAVQTDRKLIRTVNLDLETENYDELMTGLEQQITEVGGYIEYKDAYHGGIYGSRSRNASLTARIPANRLDEFTGKVAEIGNVTYESESVEDVTLQYVDLSSHKKMLVAERDRLMEFLNEAETMEDIITLESRLSEVRYQIESMESQLRTFDNQVDYSTVHISVNEVERYTPMPEQGTWDRIKVGFMENVYDVANGLEDFFVEFIIAIPVLLVYAVIIIIAVIIVRALRKRSKRKAAEREALPKSELMKSLNFSGRFSKKNENGSQPDKEEEHGTE